MKTLALFFLAAIAAISALAQQPPATHDLGYKDTPILPGLPWHVHDPNRPHPEHIQPANTPGGPPSDAVVLFDGGDLSRWVQRGKGADAGKLVDARWKVGDGWFEVAPETGDLLSREKFGDCQIHVEWSSPTEIHANSQARGNSGVLIMSRYEIQVLDAWQNPTYADGQAGAIYGQWPPLVNPARRPGEWNTYDIVFDAPRFDGQKLVRPGYVTVFYNDVVVHHHKEIRGAMVYRKVATYTAHAPEEPLMLQAHHDPVRYRNVWVRRLNGYDRPEA